MAYNEQDRSELERRFENLVKQTYGRPVDELFTAQKRVDVKGKTYRIDYVPKSNPNIAIELDGMVKFRRYGETLSKFTNRQNDLVEAGYTPIRLTWQDVHQEQGKKALERIKPYLGAATRRESAPSPSASPSVSVKQYDEIFKKSSLPGPEQFKRVPSYTLKGESLYSLSERQLENLLEEIRQLAMTPGQKSNLIWKIEQARKDHAQGAVWYGEPEEVFPVEIPNYTLRGKSIYTISESQYKSFLVEIELLPVSIVQRKHIVQKAKKARQALSPNAFWAGQPEELFPAIPWPLKENYSESVQISTGNVLPWPTKRKAASATPYKKAAIGLIGIAAIAFILNSTRYSAPQEETNMPPRVSEVIQTENSRIRASQPSQKKFKADKQNKRIATRSNNRISAPPIHRPVEPNKPKALSSVANGYVLPPPLKFSLPQRQQKPPDVLLDVPPPVESAQPPESSPPDETVAFNQASGIYHKPGSYWAQKCTRNCINIPKSEAVRLGGRASRADH